MKRLHEVARGLRRGERIRIRYLALDGSPEGKRFSPALTDAQIYAYHDRRVLEIEHSEDGKELRCVIIDDNAFDDFFIK